MQRAAAMPNALLPGIARCGDDASSIRVAVPSSMTPAWCENLRTTALVKVKAWDWPFKSTGSDVILMAPERRPENLSNAWDL